MTAYLARVKDTHEMIGIFTVDHDHELFDLVDEVCETEDVELTPLGIGGIVWLDHAKPLPLKENGDGSYKFPAGASFNGDWLEKVIDEVPADDWRPMPPQPGIII